MRGPWGTAEGLPGMRAGRRAGAGRGHGASGRMGLWGLAAPLGAEPGRCWSLGFSGAAAEAGRVPGSLDGAAWAPSHKSVLAVWPWGTPRGRPSQGCSGLRLTKACSSPQNADLGGQGGERGEDQGRPAGPIHRPPAQALWSKHPSPAQGLLPSTGEERTEIKGYFSV